MGSPGGSTRSAGCTTSGSVGWPGGGQVGQRGSGPAQWPLRSPAVMRRRYMAGLGLGLCQRTVAITSNEFRVRRSKASEYLDGHGGEGLGLSHPVAHGCGDRDGGTNTPTTKMTASL